MTFTSQMHEPAMSLIPMVVEQTSRGERSYDIYSSNAVGAICVCGRN